MKTEYDTKAESFLTENGLKLRITLSDSKPAPWSPAGHHYRVTLSRDKSPRPIYSGTTTKPDRITFDFWDSINAAEKGTSPTAYDVLACISGDAYCPETFADFCAEYGYDEESLKAMQTWKRADSFARRIRAFFTAAELAQLSEIQ